MSLIHSSIFERATANFSCPSGGTWYSCASSLFLGCCKSDNACSSVGCAAGNLQPATFDISLYGKIPDQNCPVDSLWYTCTATDPPFIGCCKINPCETGSCPANGLAAAILKADNDAAFSPTGGSSTTSSTTSSASYTTSTSLTSSSTSSSMSSASTIPVASGTSPPVNHHDTPTATIAGASAGGAVGVVAIIAMILYCRRHARKSRQAKQEDFQRRRSFPMRGAVSTCEQPKHSSPHDSAPTPTPVYEPFNPYNRYSPYSSPTSASSPGSQLPPGYPQLAHDHMNAMRPGYGSQQHAPAVSELGGLGIQPLVLRAELENTSPYQ